MLGRLITLKIQDDSSHKDLKNRRNLVQTLFTKLYQHFDHRGQTDTEIPDCLKFKWFPNSSSTLLQARLAKKLLMLDRIQLLQKQKKGDV